MGKFMMDTFTITNAKVMDCWFKILYYPNKKLYIGQFSENQPHGKGELRHYDGSVVNGMWDNGRLLKAPDI